MRRIIFYRHKDQTLWNVTLGPSQNTTAFILKTYPETRYINMSHGMGICCMCDGDMSVQYVSARLCCNNCGDKIDSIPFNIRWRWRGV